MRRYFILCIATLFTLTNAFSQSKEELQKQFDAFRTGSLNEYKDFRQKQNLEYAQFLSNAWAEYSETKAFVPPTKDIIPEPITFDPKKVPARTPSSKIVEDIVVPKPTKRPSPAPTIELEPVPNITIETPEPEITFEDKRIEVKPLPTKATAGQGEIAVKYYSETLILPWIYKKTPELKGVSEKEFSKYWKEMSSDSKPTVDFIDGFAKELKLNGWGYYELVRQVSEAVYSSEMPDNRIAFQVYFLSQLGFKAKAAVCGETLVILLPFTQRVYSVPYLTIDGQDYFIYSYGHDGSNGYRTYNKDFEGATQTLNLAMENSIMYGKTVELELPLWSDIVGEKFSVDINQIQLEMEYNYPVVDPDIFYNQSIPEALSSQVLSVLKFKTQNLSEMNKVSYLLNLIQNGFEYITDNEAFGRQKQLFVEESFFYGKNNCKDRVAIFSWLVEELVGLDVVYVFYEGTPKSNGVAHIACAVAFNSNDVRGDAYIIGGRRFTVCDPTYINAGIGLTMSYYDVTDGQIRLYR